MPDEGDGDVEGPPLGKRTVVSFKKTVGPAFSHCYGLWFGFCVYGIHSLK